MSRREQQPLHFLAAQKQTLFIGYVCFILTFRLIPKLQMVKAMQRRLIKRGLELIGAVAVVYLMLELLDSHTSDQADVAGVCVSYPLVMSRCDLNCFADMVQNK